MKKSIFLLLTISTATSFSYAQNKSYISVDGGFSFPFVSNQVSNAMKANGFGDNYDFQALFGGTGRTQNPGRRCRYSHSVLLNQHLP